MIPCGVDGVARIGLMFLDGDDLEQVLIDQQGYTDYRFEPFNRLRACLRKTEELDPDMDVSAILWRFIPDNDYVVEPLVCGNALPQTSWRRVFANEEQRAAYLQGKKTERVWKGKCVSHYYPMRNSNGVTVGLLELLVDRGYRRDADPCDMFMAPVEAPESDEE